MGRPLRLAALLSHPIQYQAPLFRTLARRREIDLTVYYCSRYGVDPLWDAEFGRRVQWDVPLLDGYRSVFLPNCSTRPGLFHFFGLLNPAVMAALFRGRYDALLVHGYAHATHWLAVLAARITGTALLLRGESTRSDPRPYSVETVKRAILSPLLRSAKACLYIGSRNRQFYEHYGVESNRLFFAPYAVDNAFFGRPVEEVRVRGSRFRSQLGISEHLPIILAAGKLTPKKQPLHLLDAFGQLRKTRACALVYAGEGELRSVVENACKERAIPDVYITGFLNQTEMPSAYAAADILVLPSGWGETWGLVVNEGMNCGLPVVVTDRVGCVDDLVRPGQNGYVVPWNDSHALAGALDILVEDAHRRMRFGRRSLEIIQSYSIDHTADGIVQGALACA